MSCVPLLSLPSSHYSPPPVPPWPGRWRSDSERLPDLAPTTTNALNYCTLHYCTALLHCTVALLHCALHYHIALLHHCTIQHSNCTALLHCHISLSNCTAMLRIHYNALPRIGFILHCYFWLCIQLYCTVFQDERVEKTAIYFNAKKRVDKCISPQCNLWHLLIAMSRGVQ